MRDLTYAAIFGLLVVVFIACAAVGNGTAILWAGIAAITLLAWVHKAPTPTKGDRG